METFLSFIFITILIIYLGGLVGKWLFRRWIARKQKEFAEKFGGQAGGFSQFYTWSSGPGVRPGGRPRQDGEVKIERMQAQEKKASKQVGDYVDYVEEVED